MKLIVFGATGKTGQHVWRQALEQGLDVTAFARSVDKIDRGDSTVRVVQGDITDAESVASAVAGHDAAIVALGSNGLRDKATSHHWYAERRGRHDPTPRRASRRGIRRRSGGKLGAGLVVCTPAVQDAAAKHLRRPRGAGSGRQSKCARLDDCARRHSERRTGLGSLHRQQH